MTDAELADHLDNFAELTPEVALSGLTEGTGEGLGSRMEGKLRNVPYDEAPLRMMCDRQQWVADNSPYEVRAVAWGTRLGWYFGIDVIDQKTGEKIDGAGFDPELILPEQDEDINYMPKRIYVYGTRVVDRVINYMIEKGLTYGS